MTTSGCRPAVSREDAARTRAMPSRNIAASTGAAAGPAPCHSVKASAAQKTRQNSTLTASSSAIQRGSSRPASSPGPGVGSDCRPTASDGLLPIPALQQQHDEQGDGHRQHGQQIPGRPADAESDGAGDRGRRQQAGETADRVGLAQDGGGEPRMAGAERRGDELDDQRRPEPEQRRADQREHAHRGRQQQGAGDLAGDGGDEPDPVADPPHEGAAEQAGDHQRDREQARVEGDLGPADPELLLQRGEYRADAVEQESQHAQRRVQHQRQPVADQHGRAARQRRSFVQSLHKGILVR